MQLTWCLVTLASTVFQLSRVKSYIQTDGACRYTSLHYVVVCNYISLKHILITQPVGSLSYFTHRLPDRLSAYRVFRSTETAIARLLFDILLALDAGDISALALLDLSAAFDSVDHTIVPQRLRTSFSLSNVIPL